MAEFNVYSAFVNFCDSVSVFTNLFYFLILHIKKNISSDSLRFTEFHFISITEQFDAIKIPLSSMILYFFPLYVIFTEKRLIFHNCKPKNPWRNKNLYILRIFKYIHAHDGRIDVNIARSVHIQPTPSQNILYGYENGKKCACNRLYAFSRR